MNEYPIQVDLTERRIMRHINTNGSPTASETHHTNQLILTKLDLEQRHKVS